MGQTTLTPPGRSQPAAQPALSLSRPLLIFRSLIALGVVAAAGAAISGLIGWYRTEMLTAAITVSGTMLAIALGLLYRQTAGRRNAHRTLHDVEAQISGIIDSAMDAIITIDYQQRVVLFNNAAEQVFRWPRGAVIGQRLDMLLPARFRELHGQHVEHFGSTGVTSRRMGAKTVLTGVRADGEEFPVEASISHFGDGAQKLYTVILRDVTLRVRADEALRRSKEELHELATAANHLREQEKRAIARELHDELAQALTGLKMDVAWIKDKLPTPSKPIADKLNAMESLLDTTVAATRRISSDLRPMMLDDLGLLPATEWLVQNFMERTGIHCELAIANAELDLQEPYATTVFRILQESLTNIAKHAQASNVEITLARTDGELAISVRDNGVGFAPENPRKPNSYGLIGLRERAFLLGGKVQIDSAPGKGTVIDVHLPLNGGGA